MKKTSRMFIGVAMVAFTLLSCNDTELASDGDDNNPIAKVGEKQPPDSPVIIAGDVQQWADEQLAKSSEKTQIKRRIKISEMYPRDLISGEGLGLSATSDSKGNIKYFLGDREISVEEYNRIVEESVKQNSNTKRDLSIPGVIYEDHLSWTVLITAEELDGLKKYGYLAISFEPEYQNEPVSDEPKYQNL